MFSLRVFEAITWAGSLKKGFGFKHNYPHGPFNILCYCIYDGNEILKQSSTWFSMFLCTTRLVPSIFRNCRHKFKSNKWHMVKWTFYRPYLRQYLILWWLINCVIWSYEENTGKDRTNHKNLHCWHMLCIIYSLTWSYLPWSSKQR